QLRSCLLAMELCEEAGFDPELRDTVYWVALLRYLGCTGHAHEIATVFGDDIAVLAETLVLGGGDPPAAADAVRSMVMSPPAVTGRTTRSSPTSSRPTGGHGSTRSTRWTRGTP